MCFFRAFWNIYSGLWSRQCMYCSVCGLSLVVSIPCTPPRVAWWQLGHPMMLQSCRQYLIITLYIILSYKYINQHLEYEHTFICAIVHINTLLIVSVELICTAWYPPVYRTLVQSPVHHPGKRIIRQDAEYDFFVVGWNRYEVLKCRVSKKLT